VSDAAVARSRASGPDAPAFSDGYRRYALCLLLVVYVFNFIDRQILSILLPPIKQEIELSDAQLGLLGGVAFAVFYSFAGIPIARWADKGVRRNIIALGLLIWSGMTALTGLARGFGGLAAARVGVGIGEAAGSPPSHSLISDYFPPERRATALSIYSLGIPIGAAIGTLAGGWIGEYFGWRMAFMAVGVPGVVLAIVVRLTLREPPRGHSEGGSATDENTSAGEVIRFLLGLASFRHLSFAGSLHAFAGYGAALFIPSFFVRVHEFGLAELSTYLFFIGLTGMIGTYLGGHLGDRYGLHDARWYAWIPAIATALGVPFAIAFYAWPTPYVALMLAVPPTILGPMYLGPTFAMTQTLVKLRMRATASAILLFILNLIGLGIGPWFVGALSDLLQPQFGAHSIRWALLFVVAIGNAWAAIHYLLAARTLRSDLRAKDR